MKLRLDNAGFEFPSYSWACTRVGGVSVIDTRVVPIRTYVVRRASTSSRTNILLSYWPSVLLVLNMSEVGRC